MNADTLVPKSTQLQLIAFNMQDATVLSSAFDFRTYAQSIMLPDGRARDTSTEGWEHGPRHIGSTPGSSTPAPPSSDEDGSSTDSEGAELMEEMNEEVKVHELQLDGSSDNAWTTKSLLRAISIPDEPGIRRLEACEEAKARLEDAFIMPVGLENTMDVLHYFKDDQVHDVGASDQKKRKRKRDRRNDWVHKRRGKNAGKDKVNDWRAEGRREKRTTILPHQRNHQLSRHGDTATIVGGSVLSTDLEHSVPGWIGVSGKIESNVKYQEPFKHSAPPVDFNPEWSEVVKECVRAGWTYVENFSE